MKNIVIVKTYNIIYRLTGVNFIQIMDKKNKVVSSFIREIIFKKTQPKKGI